MTGIRGIVAARFERARRLTTLPIFLWSRLALWVGALAALALIDPAWLNAEHAPPIDARDVTGVWARWDSYYFLQIAERGYDGAEETAFFPLYPATVAVLGRLLSSEFVLAGILVSLAACFASFELLYRLAADKLGDRQARRAVLYLAIFPVSFFLQAVYSESLLLLLSLVAFVLAERGRFLPAAVAAGLALLTRPAGACLLLPLALLAWRSPDRLRSLAALAVAPALFGLYPLVLWQQTGDPLAFARSQAHWDRELALAGPLQELWRGLQGGWRGVEMLWATASSGTAEPLRPHVTNMLYVAFLLLFIGLTAVAVRRLAAPYWLYAVSSLALPLFLPPAGKPLLSLPRFGLVVFPFFLALTVLGERQRVHRAIVLVSLPLLAYLLVEWAFWQWVA